MTPSVSWAQGVKIQDAHISAELNEASLISVAGDIERQSGISFKGDESLLEEKVSVFFKDLPLEQGIKRILAGLNYSLLFDSRGNVSEVMIMSEESISTTSGPQLRGTQVRPVNASPARQRPVVRRPGATTSPFVSGESRTPFPTRSRTTTRRLSPQRPTRTAPSARRVPAAESNLPEPFRTIESPPPEGAAESLDGPLHPAFKVVERDEPAAERVKRPREIPKPATVQKEDKPAEKEVSNEEAPSSPQKD
ncbi:MAG: hypothetical protein JW836_08890 [Deltaproteobacteria bacterium]|nr:hypothetical protein [Deltaproteobacteria bacterium]